MTETRHDSVVIERHFDAPVDLIWKMWTDPKHFRVWYGPPGASIPVAEMDVRVGGQRLVCLAVLTPNGPVEMWFAGEYREVIENERLIYTESMSDKDGNIALASGPSMSPGHPVATEVQVALEDLGGRTKMVLTHTGIPAGSPGATGWTMAFDKLAAYLAAPSVS